MAEAVKNIKFRTTVEGNKPVLDSFNQLGESVQKLNPELSKVAVTVSGKLSPALQNVSRRDMGIFATQMLTSTGITGKFTSQLSNLATGLAMGGFIGAAFAGAAALINLITENANKGEEEVGKLAKAFENLAKAMIKVKSPFEGIFEFTPELLDKAIARLDAKIKEYNIARTPTVEKTGPLGAPTLVFPEVTAEEIERLDKNKELIEIFKGQKEQLEAQKELYEILKDLGGAFKGDLKEQAEIYENIAQIIDRDIITALERMEDIILPDVRWAGMHRRGKQTATPGGGGVGKGLMSDESIKKTINQFEQIAIGWRNILDSNFSSFWQKTFGEANSLLEQLLMSTFQSVFSQIASSLISFLPGGGLFGFLGGLFGGGAGGAGPSQPIVIQIGDEDVARVVLRGNKVIQQRRMS